MHYHYVVRYIRRVKASVYIFQIITKKWSLFWKIFVLSQNMQFYTNKIHLYWISRNATFWLRNIPNLHFLWNFIKVWVIARNTKVRRGITFYKKSFGSQFTLFSLLMMTDYVLGEKNKKMLAPTSDTIISRLSIPRNCISDILRFWIIMPYSSDYFNWHSIVIRTHV